GDRANALQIYHRCMSVLREELGVDPSPNTRKLYEQLLREEEATNSPTNETIASAPASRNAVIQASIATDWGEAIDVSIFYGRETEQTILHQWSINDRSRLLMLVGMGGIGKTTLSIKWAQSVQHEFELIIWRSLRNAPPLETLLADLIPFLSHQQDSGTELNRLLHWLRHSRCLIILDNLETILQEGDGAGSYRTGYENYGELLRLVAETTHQSCLLLTSREKPAEVGILESANSPVRSLLLSGSPEAARALLDAKGLVGTDAEKQQVCDRYSCSPLALKIVATSIQSLFDSKIALFLEQDAFVFQGIRQLLDQQFRRLTEVEKIVMYWLAINREWTSSNELIEDIVPTPSRTVVLEALEALSRRSLLEIQLGSYTQQPVVMEFVTERFVNQIIKELTSAELSLFIRYCLIKTTVKDYVRESQVRLILNPIAAQFRHTFNTQNLLKQRISQILTVLQQPDNHFSGYGCGNLINLCSHLQFDLRAFNFSNLIIWHAYLQKVNLRYVDLSHTIVNHSVFTQTFGSILAVAFSSNQYLAAADTSGEVWFWRTQLDTDQLVSVGQPHLSLRAHSDWVWSIDFSPDGQMLASASDDQTIKIWDINTGRCLQQLFCGSKVRALAWSPDQQFLASGSVDQCIRIWEPYMGQCLKTLQGHDNKITTVAWKPMPSTSSKTEPQLILATSSADQTVKLWDILSNECVATLQGHNNAVLALAWSSDGCTLASGGNDQTIRLWDVETQECLNCLEGHTNAIWSIVWNIDRTTIASGSDDQTVRVWNAYTGQCVKVLQNHQNSVRSLAWNLDGQVLASGSFDQTIRLWHPRSGSHLKTLQGYRNTIHSTSWHPDGRILASGGDDCQVSLWDSNTGQRIHLFEGHSHSVWTVAWSADGQTLASCSDDQTIRLWDLESKQCLRKLEGHSSLIWTMAWSPTGQLLASGSHDHTVRLWNPLMGRCLKVLKGHENWVRKLAWSPNGQLLATGSYDQTLRLWNPSDGSCAQILRDPNNWVWSIAFAPDGKTLASGSTNGEIKLWDVATGDCLTTLQAHKNTVWSIIWSADGQTLISGSHDQTIKRWRLRDGQCLSTLEGHTNLIWTIALNPDDQILTSSGADEVIKLWNLQTGECFKSIKPERPYEGTNITGIQGLTEAQKINLKALGAIEDEISGHE
ncbi:BTAD domain-containing putative transcriptional regulator, partial [Oculatella sp. FACHB-28]|uniref:WD40 domain-containing protein n=1 Tax=Oculatella sp. FACHB-28 TaxID=2692845 RepID=UPI0018EF497F